MTNLKKKNMSRIVELEYNKLLEEREDLIEELKHQFPNSKNLEFITKTIASYNVLIKELEKMMNVEKSIIMKGESE